MAGKKCSKSHLQTRRQRKVCIEAARDISTIRCFGRMFETVDRLSSKEYRCSNKTKKLHRLDDMVSRKGDLKRDDIMGIKSLIENYEVGAAVLFKKALDNRKFRTVLGKMGFRRSRIVDNHLLLVRETSETKQLRRELE